MRRIRLLLRLTPQEQGLLIRTTLLVAAVRIALWTLPFAYICRWLNRQRPGARGLAVIPVKSLAWAVATAARRIPRASCLTQALALQYLLARAGKSAQLHIGVAKIASGGFESHAWVGRRGEILLGDNGELDRYSPMLTLSTEEI